MIEIVHCSSQPISHERLANCRNHTFSTLAIDCIKWAQFIGYNCDMFTRDCTCIFSLLFVYFKNGCPLNFTAKPPFRSVQVLVLKGHVFKRILVLGTRKRKRRCRSTHDFSSDSKRTFQSINEKNKRFQRCYQGKFSADQNSQLHHRWSTIDSHMNHMIWGIKLIPYLIRES